MRATRRVVSGFASAFAISSAARGQVPPVDSVAALVPLASYVFVGEVASRSIPAAPAVPGETRRLVGFRVIDPVQAPPSMPLRIGERIRLLVDSSDVPAVGTRAVVFATGWLVADRISLIQVARLTVHTRAEWSGFEATYDSLRLATERAALQRSVAASDMTVVGAVTSVVSIPDARPPIARSEHDPVWAHVSISPIVTLEGTGPPGDGVALLIPTSRSHIWHRVPTLTRGDTALFVLTRIGSTSPLLRIDSTARFVLFDSVSVRPPRDTLLLRAARRP